MNGLSGCRTLFWRSAGKRVLWRYTFLWTVPLEMDVCTSSVPLKKMLAKLIEHFMAGGLTVGTLLCAGEEQLTIVLRL